MSFKVDDDLLNSWFDDMLAALNEYREPILNRISVSMVRSFCDALAQDVHVFVMSVEIIERYIEAKQKRREAIVDNLLTIAASVLIASKYTGAEVDVKISQLNMVVNRISNFTYSSRQVNQAEIDIMAKLNNCLPVTTIVDDVTVFVERFMRGYQLKVDIRNLCLSILQLFYVLRKECFQQIKDVYNINDCAFEVFDRLVRSKVYIPMGITVCALKLTKYNIFLNIDNIIKEMSELSKIHTDHLYIVSDKLMSFILAQIE